MALFESGVDPVVLGLAVGLITWAYPAGRGELERATDLFRSFREQPTPELARSASVGLRAAVSPNARLLQLYHPWTSYVIVPLFALANVGIAIDGDFLSRAYSSPITLGIIFAYVLGKPVGVAGVSWLVTRLSRGRLRPPVGWAATVGGGAIAGIGFTVSLLIAALAFHGAELREAKLGVLSAALCASALTWLVFRATAMLPRRARIRALLGGLGDARRPRRAGRSRARPPARPGRGAGDGGRVRRLRVPLLRPGRAGDARAARRLRRRPLRLAPPAALRRPPATPSSPPRPPRRPPRRGPSGRCTTCCSTTRASCSPATCRPTPSSSASTSSVSARTCSRHAHAPRVEEDVDSADISGVTGTPTFFVNERRHDGAYDIDTLSAAVRAAGARSGSRPRRRSAGGALLLLDRQLGGREGLEALVGDRLAALDRDAVGAGAESHLGALDGGEPPLQVLEPAGVELVLVEALRVDVAGLDPAVSLFGAAALRSPAISCSICSRSRASSSLARSGFTEQP